MIYEKTGASRAKAVGTRELFLEAFLAPITFFTRKGARAAEWDGFENH